MALRINTNVAALTAHTNMIKNDNGLSGSLEKLSSGLRINRAADDASGMAIADSLKSQYLGLGQAIRNANDGISMVQTADGALDESIKIVNTIKTKSIQAAQDGQTTESRKAIQADINKLMEELNTIAKTTAFNGQKLLSGQFTNKAFQVGAYTGETVGISIGSTEGTKIGHVSTATMTPSGVGEVRLSIYSNLQNQDVSIQSQTLAYDNTRENSIAALADSINKVADLTGVTAQAFVAVSSNNAVAAGTTGSDFAINGVTIGSLAVVANDADGSLVSAINQKSSQHGVTAAVDEAGYLTLTSNDGRAIKVTGDTGVTLAGSNLATLGEIKLFQTGANEIKISDAADNATLSTTAAIALADDSTWRTDSTLTKNSILVSGSKLAAGSTLGFKLSGTNMASGAGATTTADSILTAGSVLGSSSLIEKGTVLGGTAQILSTVTTSADSLLKTGSIIASDSTLAAGTVVGQLWVNGSTTYNQGDVLASDVTVDGALTMSTDWVAKTGSVLVSNGTSLTRGSYAGVDIRLSDAMTASVDMTLKAGSVISSSATTIIQVGSSLGIKVKLSDGETVSTDMTLKAGSVLVSGTDIGKGSTLGGNVAISGNATLSTDMTLAAGSILVSASTLKAGTVLTNDIWVQGGVLLKAGTVLAGDAITSGTNYLTNSMTLKADSVIAQLSTLSYAATAGTGATATTTLSDKSKFRLSDIDVTSQEGAQLAIALADSALKNLDKTRSDLGSVQNQLTSTIANLSATKVNIASAESSIRDVDFAEEAANFSKMQVLNQAGSFAMSQANASAKNVLSLLQG
ncbi:MAG: flagellin [Thermodesulfobacteriota bacterium]